MKKHLAIIFSCIVIVLSAVVSCTPASKGEEFDEALIYGVWSCSDGYYYDFGGDHSGRSYDDRDKGLDFVWSLDGDELQIIFKGSDTGVSAPKNYVITTLSINVLKCYDITDKSETLTFQKQ